MASRQTFADRVRARSRPAGSPGHAGIRDAHDGGRGIVCGETERRSDMLGNCAPRRLDIERFQFATERALRIDAPSTTCASVKVGRVLPCP